jgi:long-chain acyl-CoA synthetase
MTASIPIQTINDLFFRVVERPRRDAVLWQDSSGAWQAISTEQFYQRVRAVADALLGWGVAKGDRVALISENRWEWGITDFATLAIGAVNVPIYPTLTGEQIAGLVNDAGCRVAFVSSLQQFQKLQPERGRTSLEYVVMMDSSGTEGAIPFSSLMEGVDARGGEKDAAFEQRARAVRPEDLATLIYTSGTTGEPKGVMLTHGNIASNQNLAACDFRFGTDDLCISFLPLSHITARALDYVMYGSGAQIAYCNQFDKLPLAMKELRPTVFVGVPRVYEKIRQAVEQRAGANPVRKRLLALAVKIGAHHRDAVYAGNKPGSGLWKIAKKLVYSKVHDAFGGRVRIFVSGGAPLGIDTARWFASVGVAVWEGYGLTETSPVIALNTGAKQRMGSVGQPLANVELKLAEDDELLVRGPSVFQGYWHKPAANTECFDADGWFKTGDIAHVDKDGFLYITDRKKELLKTSGGKLVAPQPIENKLKQSVMVGQVALVGDKHKFISALISPNFAALEPWAKEQGIEANDRAALVANPRVYAMFKEMVQSVNAGLANFESIKRFRLVPDEWSQDTGELTPSMKLKKRIINQRYAAVVGEIYADEATAHAD